MEGNTTAEAKASKTKIGRMVNTLMTKAACIAIHGLLITMLLGCNTVQPNRKVSYRGYYYRNDQQLHALKKDVQINQDPDSAFEIAMYYYMWVEDEKAAWSWFEKASALGSPQAKRWLVKLGSGQSGE